MIHSRRTLAALLAILALGLASCSGTGEVETPDVTGDVQSCTTADDCVTDNPCVTASCEDGLCIFTPVTDGETCDDGDGCTTGDACKAGACVGTPISCDDGLFCNGLELCDPATGECGDGAPLTLDDGIECTLDECDEDADEVTHTPDDAFCDDGDPCTTDSCDEEGGCDHQAHFGVCDDGDLCTTDDSCALGTCAGTPVACSDGSFCNGEESCDAETGECVDGEVPQVDDGVDCTVDACDDEAGEVTHTPDDAFCDDENPCTIDTCDPESGCQYENSTEACDDGDACTDGDLCTEGVCQPGEWVCFEDCANGEDDDKDGLPDCLDDDCTWELVCMGDGETCEKPWVLNQGQAIGIGSTVEFAATTIGKLNDFAGDCSKASGSCPDTIHQLEVAEPVGVTVTVDFVGQAWPALMLLGADCQAELGCKAATSSDDVSLVDVLLPGTYYLVVDGNFVDGAGNGDAADYTLLIETFAPAAKETGCTNGIDDDGDGFLDCLDSDCDAFPACQESAGESCQDAIVLFGGPVSDAGETVQDSYQGTTKGMSNDLGGSCDADTENAPDMVFTFTLEDPMWLTVSHDFDGALYPALYLLDEGCDSGEELACEKAFEGPAELSLPLGAGTWYLVVDGAYGLDAGKFTLDALLAPLADTEDDCANGFDDDMDGLADCDDDDCFEDVFCVGFPGDTCGQAFPINDGKPIGEADSGLSLTYTGTTKGLLDHYSAACDADTAGSPDAVYVLNLSSPMTVTFSHDFDGNAYPALYVLGAECGNGPVLGCATAFSPAAVLNITLPAGTFYIVIDASFAGDAGTYTFIASFAQAPSYELECNNGIDDDMDGDIDCKDLDCEAETFCLDPYEVNDGIDLAYDLGVIGEEGFESEVGAMIFPEGDEDWFRFEVAGPSFVHVQAIPTGEVDLKLALMDGQGVLVDSADVGTDGEEESLVYAMAEAGTLYVAIEGFQDSFGEYALLIVVEPPAETEQNCVDAADDDLDGKVDCEDEDCALSPFCGAGDTCEEATLINDGEPLDATFDGVQLDLAGSTVGYADDYAGTCSDASDSAPDAVWKLVLGDTLLLSAVVDFEGYKYPALYLRKGACDGEEVACGAGGKDPLAVETLLEPGTYFLFVDGNWSGDASPYSLSLLFASVQSEETECGDGLDNDQDGAADCEDDDCALDEACRGRVCGFPFLVNEGVAITAADDGLTLTYQGDTTGFSNDYAGSCAAESADSPDAVYQFELTDEMNVVVSHDFEGIYWPAVYVVAGDCATGEEVLCATGESDAAVASGILGPGTYFVFVDASFFGDEAPYTLELTFALPLFVEEECSDGIDDDGDGLIDCADTDCAIYAWCEGEACTNPLFVNDGAAITAAADGTQLVITGSTVDHTDDHAGSCDADTGDAPDVVYQMELADPMVVTISHGFDGYFYPAVYLLSSCVPADEMACATNTSNAAVIEELLLTAGTYYIVVDASFADDASDYTLTIDFAAVPANETDCGDGKDNDGDGLTDCCDDDCVADPSCVEGNCGDNLDGDCDGKTDCEDDECAASAFCVVQSLPFAEDFEDDGDAPDGWAQAGPDAECEWTVDAEGADGTSWSMKLDYGGCSETDLYKLYSPQLDLSGCDEIGITFQQQGAYITWIVWHEVGVEGEGVENGIDVAAPGETFALTDQYIFDVSGLESGRIYFGYLGDNADDWWVDEVLVECTVPAETPPLAPGDVIITEFMANPATVSDADGEWLELFNTSGQAIDLAGCILSDADNDSHAIVGPLSIPAGGTLVLGASADDQVNGGIAVDYAYADYFLSNSVDEIILTCGEVVLDSVYYDDAFPVLSGQSTQLAPDHYDATANDSAGFWCAANPAIVAEGDLGTPGALNHYCSEIDCTDGGDDDLDGAIDCDDDDCLAAPVCPEALCDDLEDNDFDELTDCEDDDCATSPFCMDSDEDGVVDAADLCPGFDDAIDEDQNGLADGCEIDWAGMVWPNGGTSFDTAEDATFFVQVYKGGITEPAGQGANVEAKLLYKMDGDEGWQELAMVYNVDQDNNDEYKATVPSAFTVGGGTLVIDFAIRYLPPGVVGADYLYDVAVTDQENAEAPLSYPITGDAPPQIQAGDLLFTEVMQNPTGVGDDTGEYFEIYNTTDGAIDVEGWTVKSANDADFVISNGGNSVVVAAGTYFVFVRHVDALGTESVPYFSYEKAFNLGNSSDDLALVTPAGLTVDSVAWDNGATFPDPAGASMQLHNDPSVMTHEANDLGTNWCTATVAFSTGDAGSPGAANEACP